jgi:RHS repeat-associated protein
MSDALWAARVGDALAHTSMMADILGGVLEVAANVAIGALATAAVVAATGITVATGGIGACVLGAVVGLVVGVVMSKTGADKGLSRICEDIGNGLFPPTVQATISTGSTDTFINGIPAARAAGSVPSMLTPSGSPEETPQAEDQPEPEASYLDMAKGFFSQMWRPTVAMPGPGVVPKPLDLVLCTRHPPMPPQLLAEGSDKVTINGQPAVRSGDRSTCDATVVSSGLISPNVRIGGGKVVVREIRSGKTPGVGLAITALMMLKGSKGKFLSNLPCMLLSGVNSFVVSSAMGALTQAIAGSPNPVHAATGAKVLGDVEDLDFALPAMLPIEWQRFYNSRDERRASLFGAGWSVPYEVCVQIEAHPDGGERFIYIDEQARRIDMGAIPLGGATFSAGEGLAVRRHGNGQLLIESEDGLYRLFEPAASDPALLHLTQLGDRNDNRIHLDYNAEGQLVQLRDSHDVLCLNLAYSARWPGRVERIERAFSDGVPETLASYAFDGMGNLAEVRDAAGNLQRRFTYDEHQRMVEHQLPTGLRCFYEWALIGEREWRVVHHWTDEGDEYHFSYDLDAGITQIVDGLKRRSTRRWNSQHQITEYTDALDKTWRFVWNDERQLLSAIDPRGGKWQYSYDDAGNLSSTEDPLGRIDSTLWLEHWSLPKVQTDAAGNQWQYRYDARGNCTHETDPLGHITRYHFDERGRVIEIIDAAGKTNRLRWNESGQLTDHLDCSGYRTEFNYNRRGLLESIVDTLAETTSYQYDAQGRLVQRQWPDGRTERYQRDPSGLLTGYLNGAGELSRYHYNRRGQVRHRIDPHNRQVQFHYDAYGRLNALTNENGENYRFAWDAGDRLSAQQDLDGSQRRYRYDALGNPVQVDQLAAPDGSESSRESIAHQLERDAAGRLVAKVTDDGRTTYEYDLLDNLIDVTFTDADGEKNSVGFSYDALGQLLSETTTSGTVQHRYDEIGNLIQTQTPDGRWINRLLYGSGHLHQINLDGQVISDFERDRLHREVLRTQGQMNTRSEYDRIGRLNMRTRRLSNQPRPLPAESIRTFEYDPVDNLTARVDSSRQGTLRTLLGYDSSGRIMSAQDNRVGQLETFAYDAAANLVDGSQSGASRVPHNRLRAFQDKRYRYDGFGRLIEKTSIRHGTQRFAYDAESRLSEVRNPNGHVVRMTYDPLGRRIAKREHHPSGYQISETKFTWDGLRLLMEEQNSLPTLYLYADNSHEPLARVDGRGAHQKIRYYHNALNGLPEQLTEPDGQIVWQARYQVWGNTVEETREAYFVENQNLRFQGQYLDRETGLHYNTFRFYDPDVGRFTTPDPIGLAGGLNLYQYAPNPIGWIDPLGWKPCFRDAKAQAHAESIIKRHGGVAAGENRYKMPNRRAARQAASEIAGNLGSEPRRIKKSDFRGGPSSWKNSQDKIGMQNKSETSGWRDDSPGHPTLGAGPHVNAWNNEKGITSNLHLDY